jgi:2-hydroxycyclohexanecarboxyl-CoA dehydrogenase
MELDLKGKTVVVTGSGSNIGRAIALSFGTEGCNTVVVDIDEKQGNKVAQEINAKGVKALYVKTDVTNPSSVETMVATTLKEFGQLDILVNSVGFVIDRLFIEKPRAEWEKEVNLNLWSTINCTRAVLDHMIARKYGKIISLSSDAGRIGEFREGVYSACKAGIIAMSKSIAKELGRYNINVNVVCPSVIVPDPSERGDFSFWKGDMETIFTPEVRERVAKSYPLRRMGKASEVADAVVFLASKAADYITGQTLSVNGGYTMM